MILIANIIGCGCGVSESLLLALQYLKLVEDDSGNVADMGITQQVFEFLISTEIPEAYAAYLKYYYLVDCDGGQIGDVEITHNTINSLVI